MSRSKNIPIGLVWSNLVLRNIYKVIYKYSHPKIYKHNRRYWPYYHVERNLSGGIDKIFFKKKLIVNNTINQFTPQKKCMLVTTGPSVQKIPKKLFHYDDYDYIGVNGAISLADVYFKYYVIIDHNFTNNRFDLVLKVLNSECTFFTTPRCLDLILRKIHPDQIRCQIKVIEPITEGEIERFLGPRLKANIAQDYYFIEANKGFAQHTQDAVFDYFTVAYVALQIIYELAYSEVYIAGLDMSNFNQPRFYEQDANKQPTMLDQYLTETLPAFDIAAHCFQQKNIQVYNLSPESAVNSFEKLDPTQ